MLHDHQPAHAGMTDLLASSCMFISGLLGIEFIVDTGCSHSLLFKTIFGSLLSTAHQTLTLREGIVFLVDGSGLTIYG